MQVHPTGGGHPLWPEVAPSKRGESIQTPSSGPATQVELTAEAEARLAESTGAQDPRAVEASKGARAAGATGEDEEDLRPGELTEEEEQVVSELKARDAEVRAHEAAHIAASGGLAGAPSYTFQDGPDGKRYAVGGEVSIDTSSGATPDETIAKMRQVMAAASAPADPSGQDAAVAAGAAQRMQAAQKAKSEEALEELEELSDAEEPDDGEAVSAASESPQGLAEAEARAVGLADEAPEPPEVPDVPEGFTKDYGGETWQGGSGHLHADVDCGYCSAAVSKYAG